jgi:hypothetical protein
MIHGVRATMKIEINGEKMSVAGPATLHDLLADLGFQHEWIFQNILFRNCNSSHEARDFQDES